MPLKKQETLPRLDPRAPLVLDTRELGRRPGSMRRLSRTVPAPAGMGIPVLGVPEGEPVHLDLRLEAVMEGVLVSGSASTRVVGECVRCLDPIEQELETGLQELYVYPNEQSTGRAVEDDDEDEVRRLDGVLLDLEPALRDAIIIDLPLQPVCREDCPGLCATCGARLADEPGHGHEVRDIRWAALAGLQQDADRREDGTSHTISDSSRDTDPEKR